MLKIFRFAWTVVTAFCYLLSFLLIMFNAERFIDKPIIVLLAVALIFITMICQWLWSIKDAREIPA